MKRHLLLISALFVLLIAGCSDKNDDEKSAGVGNGGPIKIVASNIEDLDIGLRAILAKSVTNTIIAKVPIERDGFEVTLPVDLPSTDLLPISDEQALMDMGLGYEVISNTISYSDPSVGGTTVSFVGVDDYEKEYGEVLLAKVTETGIGSSQSAYMYVEKSVTVKGSIKLRANADGYDVVTIVTVNLSLDAGWNRYYMTLTKFDESTMTMYFKLSGSRVGGLRWYYES